MFVFSHLRISDASLSGMCIIIAPVTTYVVTVPSVPLAEVPVTTSVIAVPSVSSAEVPVVSSAIDVATTLSLVCASSP